jgi:hypothetical protein
LHDVQFFSFRSFETQDCNHGYHGSLLFDHISHLYTDLFVQQV